MSTSPPSWRRVAEILAARVEHFAGVGCACPHPDPDNCPFCADRAAFQVFQAKRSQGRKVARAIPREVPDAG